MEKIKCNFKRVIQPNLYQDGPKGFGPPPVWSYQGTVDGDYCTLEIYDSGTDEYIAYTVTIHIRFSRYMYRYDSGCSEENLSTIPSDVVDVVGPWLAELGYPIKSEAEID